MNNKKGEGISFNLNQFLRMLHLSPIKPWSHSHVKPFNPNRLQKLFWHGFGLHGSPFLFDYLINFFSIQRGYSCDRVNSIEGLFYMRALSLATLFFKECILGSDLSKMVQHAWLD